MMANFLGTSRLSLGALVGVFVGLGLARATAAQAMSPREIYDKSSAAVVLVLSSDDGRTGQGGTGSIVNKDGRILTNAHVVVNEKGAPFHTIYVFLKPDRISGDNAQDLTKRYTASVKAFSPQSELDLAILQIDNPPTGLPVMGIGDSAQVNIGDPVVAIGHPEQGGLWTLTTGTISTVLQNFERVPGKNVFQTETSFNRGNSGGPLLDGNGNLIGINTMIARRAADGMAITAVNFSLKSQVATDWLKTSKLAMNLPYVQGATALSGVTAAPTDRPSRPAVALNSEGTRSKAAETAPTVGGHGNAKTPPAEAQLVATPKATPEANPPKGQETKKRPFKMDDLLRDQMKDMEDLMDDMRRDLERRK